MRRPASSLSPTTHFCQQPREYGSGTMYLPTHLWPVPFWDPGSSVRMPQNAPPSVPSPPTPFRCTTTGTSIVLLEPLAQRLEACLTLPSLSRWLTRTIRLGYAIQFARRPPKFNGVLETSAAVQNVGGSWPPKMHDPRRCMIGVVLSFLQERLERRLSPSTLKCMWPLSRPTTMQWMAGPWESMISS